MPIFRATLRDALAAALEAAMNTEEPAADAVPRATDALMIMVDTYTDNLLAAQRQARRAAVGLK